MTTVIETISYREYLQNIPKKGKCILAQQKQDRILVYQAFNNSIADFALENQFFGSASYSYARMSWIKTNFLWMMHRCGWATKENQERVLGIWIRKVHFETILQQSVYSSYQPHIYGTRDLWKKELASKPVRLQWDPDHSIYGNKQDRKAIQLGLKGTILKQFGNEMISEIIDVTSFVKEQKKMIDAKKLENLQIPRETIYTPKCNEIKLKIDLY